MRSSDVLSRARECHSAGELYQAERLCRQVLVAEPRRADALHLLGVITLHNGDAGKAATLLGEAARIQPGSAQVFCNLGAALMQLGQLDEAQGCFKSALNINHRCVDAYFNLGTLHRQDGNLDAALDCLRRAVELDTGCADAHLNLGGVLHKLGNLDAAIDAYALACRLAPDLPEAHLNTGIALLENNQPALAELSINKCIALNPDLAEAHFHLGRVHHMVGRLQNAEAAYLRATKLKPGLPSAQIRLAELWFELGDERAVLAQYNAGETLLRCGDTARALTFLDANLSIISHKTRTLSTKLVAHLKLNDVQGARNLVASESIVRTFSIETPRGFATVADFNQALAKFLIERSVYITAPKKQPECRYRQSSELLRDVQGPLQALVPEIHAAVSRYRHDVVENYPGGFPADNPPNYELQGWAVVMNGQGHKDPHFHPDGWLSGVYYPRVATVTANHSGRAGWLEVGRPDPAMMASSPHTPVLNHCPREGELVLFPSYLYHQTLPFRNDAQRISFAFDVLPAWGH